MAELPNPKHTLVASIYRWREQQADDGLRAHLGGSVIGHYCSRFLWLSFRWIKPAAFSGRMLRLFDRGQREEDTFIQELRGIGAEVSEGPAQGQQWRVQAHGGHFGGSLDGVARKLPGGSQEHWELLEFKTHNDKSFRCLEKEGVKISKPQHYAQMQVYMALTGMTRANYLAVNKNDDQIYHERVHADKDEGQALLDKAGKIIFAPEPLPKIHHDPSWWQCKMCEMHSVCHGTDAPLPTCRSCAHVTPKEDGTWMCEYHNKTLSVQQQKAGCDDHRFIPSLLSNIAEMVDASQEQNWVEYRTAKGTVFKNGQAPAGYASTEIHAVNDIDTIVNHDVISTIRETFNARIQNETARLPTKDD